MASPQALPPLLAAVLAAVAGCGVDPGPAGPPDFSASPELSLASDSGRWHATMRTSPAQVARGQNALELAVVDADGAPVDDATVEASTWMPAHGHGASVVPAVDVRGGGVYELDRVVFFMAGRWQVRATLTRGAADAELFVERFVERFVATFDVP